MRPIAFAGAVCVCVMACAAQEERPRVFSDLGFDEALRLADSQDRLLLVNAVRAGDEPSARMAETWRDEAIEVFVRDNALAIQIDIGVDAAFADEHGVSATPTLIVFRNGDEYTRRAGYMDGGDALAWLDAARAGNVFGAASASSALRERLNALRATLYSDEPEGAIEDLVELWHDTGREGQWMRTMREHEISYDIESLVYSSDAARERFTQVRDETEARLREDPNWRDLGGWIVLCNVLDDLEPVFAWIDRNKVDEQGRATIMYFGDLVEELLLAEERWADYGMLVESPLEEIEYWHEEMVLTREIMAEDGDDDGSWAETLAEETATFTATAANTHAALLAAGREQDAWEVADRAVELEDTGAVRSAIVRRAIEVGVAGERHRGLLTGVGTEDAARELEEALK